MSAVFHYAQRILRRKTPGDLLCPAAGVGGELRERAAPLTSRTSAIEKPRCAVNRSIPESLGALSQACPVSFLDRESWQA